MRSPQGTATRRVALLRRRGRFSALPAFERAPACSPIAVLRAERPVFGGRARSTLRVTIGLSAAGPATHELLRGDRVVRRLRYGRLSAGTLRRASLSGAGRSRGLYRLRLRSGGATATVAVRRL